jgi:hypothetical protein
MLREPLVIEREFWSFGYFADGFSFDYGCVGSNLGAEFLGKAWGGEDVEELPVDEEGGVDYQGPENLCSLVEMFSDFEKGDDLH